MQTVAGSARAAFKEVAGGVRSAVAGTKAPGSTDEASPPESARGVTVADDRPAPARPQADGWDAALDTARSADYLSGAEKDLVLEINKLRSNPPRYAELYLLPRRGSYSGRLYKSPGEIDIRTNEGVAALDECIAELRKSRPRGLLMPSRGLSRAARDHAADQGRTGATGHGGSDGSSTESRMDRYGRWDVAAGENISYGHGEAREILIQLAVDDGVSSRGHRRNLMQEELGYVGLSIGRHPKFGSLCVMDFAGQYADKVR